MLQRSAAADLSKNTLARIPTLFGRLTYLASLRDPNSGIHRHHGLASIFGREESRLALQQHHETVFLEWLTLSLERKREEFAEFLEGLDAPRRAVIDHWAKVRAYQAHVPASARESERELFFAEFEVLLEMFRCSDPPES